MENCSSVLPNGTGSSSCQWFPLLLKGLGITVCLVLGMAGNLASIIYINRQYAGKTRSASYKNVLRSLAIWDIMLLIGSWHCFSVRELFRCTRFREHQFFDYMVLVFHPLISISFVASGLLTVFITFLKCLAVCVPISSDLRNRCINSGRSIPIIISALAIMVNIPVVFEQQIEWCWNYATNSTKSALMPTALRFNNNYVVYYRTLFLSHLFTNTLPFFVIIGLSLATIRHVYKAFQATEALEEFASTTGTMDKRKDRRLGKSLALIVSLGVE